MSTVTPAILVLTFLLVAGGGWHWAYERHVVTYRKGDRDRLARLAAASVAYLAVAAWPLYEIYDQIWPVDAGQRSHPSWWVWPLVPAGLAVPIVIGALQWTTVPASSSRCWVLPPTSRRRLTPTMSTWSRITGSAP